MSSSAIAAKIFVGVDVSKSRLDIYRQDTNELLKIENAETAIEQFCSKLSKHR
jgi:hypothetical protein